MEFVRRALLVGFMLPAIWLSRLATLDPLVSVVSIEPAARAGEGVRIRSDHVSGQGWDLLLRDVDAVVNGLGPQSRWRAGAEATSVGGGTPSMFFRPEEIPAGAVSDQLASQGGAATVSFSRPEGDRRYQFARRDWSRQEFGPGTGFTGTPAPPGSLLYPFQYVGYALLLVGIALFAILQNAKRAADALSPVELVSLAAGLLLFAAPLVATGGSVQALTRGLLLTIPCWIFAGLAIHRFARPDMSAHQLVLPIPALVPGVDHVAAVKVWLPSTRAIGMLFVATVPLARLVGASLVLWNR
jgi:hypothetical protein